MMELIFFLILSTNCLRISCIVGIANSTERFGGPFPSLDVFVLDRSDPNYSRATHFAVQNLFVEAILKTLSNLEVDGGSPRRSLPQHEFSTDQQFLHQIGNLVEQQNKLMVNQINAMAKQDNLTEDQTKNLEDLQNDE
ncbi:hypothetical protein niasHT_013705 [Heterodera trifolii]|uniref:Uncharacterized protein n=1 Tax=Heterodera trifolii TaxID=157864 RepID=A0ABD2LBY4_9BILA